MASKGKDKNGKSKVASGKRQESERSLKEMTGNFINEVEKTSTALIDEVKQLFDGLGEKVSGVTGAALDTTSALAQKVGNDPSQYISGLLKEVQVAGEASVKAIGDSFEVLRDQVSGHDAKAPAEEKEKKSSAKNEKKASKENAVKKVAKKTVAKKKVAKKKVTKKKAAAKTSADVASQASAPKKKTVVRKTAKKAAVRKATAIKKADSS